MIPVGEGSFLKNGSLLLGVVARHFLRSSPHNLLWIESKYRGLAEGGGGFFSENIATSPIGAVFSEKNPSPPYLPE